jgi:uncharacterized LabA/DUF88 family protein
VGSFLGIILNNPDAASQTTSVQKTTPIEPAEKRAVVFVDGQNLFHTAKKVFGHSGPNYDIASLAQKVARDQGWKLVETRFYTGIPSKNDDRKWNHFWEKKLLSMSRRGVKVFSRHLKYREERVILPDKSSHTITYFVEKGIDVRIALDSVRLAYRAAYDVAVFFSQDQDLSEAADEIRVVSKEHGRWVEVASAFPYDPGLCDGHGHALRDNNGYEACNPRGIGKTVAIQITREVYDQCLDLRDYHWHPQPRY